MYKFKVIEPFACDKEKAFETTTRDFDGLEKHIKNVTMIKTETHEKSPEGVERWMLMFHGDGAIPLIARAVVKPDMLRWREELICDPRDLTIKWKIITNHFTEYFHCDGVTHYIDAPEGSRVEIDGRLWVDPMKIPGISENLVRRAIEKLEPFIGALISPNLKVFYKAIKKRENIK
ncbi:MAG: hypothetical protein BWY28_00130 [bacterium ADurb.Bin236]|nr:MAG: hypothetical protein BWY28_00130 [bacterium ADurb.Bin236]HOY63386.1 hypothetical protein [bacterium]HPN95575.1 hypothetical protein [bacterium]